mmetsp:Transcript_58454/g.173718  ORF Transcript_58454/g.173718 Transcript_58454/m.173718 type:complete len:83 (+) Transcript_58454:3-251(+)
MLNASAAEAAQEALNVAAVERAIGQMDDEVVPVVKSLALLGGMLQRAQREIVAAGYEVPQLSLATLWKPFAEREGEPFSMRE